MLAAAVMESALVREFISRSVWFQGIPDEVLDMLVAAATCRTLPANTYLWSMGETNVDIFGVLAGRVRASVSSTTGQEFVFVDQEPESWLGEACLVNDYGRIIEAKTLMASEILVINRRVVTAAGDDWPMLYRNLFRHNVQTSRGLYTLLTGMVFYPLGARVAGRLHELAREHGSRTDGGVLVGIKHSQNDFARMVMGSRQRVNRIFRDWEKRGLIEHRDDLLWIADLDVLEKEIVPFE
jgi:CRP/FNR family cyclic AMP-dependent transcriptional regulator